MIRYTLVCNNGHGFESWFPSGDAYDEQAARGYVTCPICDSRQVSKALMAPAIARKDRGKPVGSAESTESTAEASVPAPVDAPLPMVAEPERRLRALLRAVREQVVASADDVGARFPDEARAMHYGERPTRAIYGVASPDEAKALVDEGIAVAPLPPAPDDRH